MVTAVTTSTAATSSAYSTQRKVDRTSNGVLWALYVTGGSSLGTHFSLDNGATWTAGTGVPFAGTNANHTPNVSFFIDVDDFAHVAYKDRHDGALYYRRGAPNADRTAWTWSAAFALQGTNTLTDLPDVIAHREGTGWVAHVVYIIKASSTTDGFINYRRVAVAADGTISSGSAITSISPGYGTSNLWVAIDFHHSDGKSVAGGTPHLFIAWSSGATGTGLGIRFRKATYSAGSWTFGTERAIDETRQAAGGGNNWFASLFDGTRAIIGGAMTNGTSSNFVLYDRDAADTTTTQQLTVDADTTNFLFDGSLTYDQAGNVHIFGHDLSGANGTRLLNRRKWTRSGATLGPIETFDTTGSDSPYVSAKRGHTDARVEWIWTDGTASPFTVTYDALQLNVAPNAPLLLSPVGGVTIDRDIVQRFDWDFSDPDAGDSQSAYDLQYRAVGTATWTVVSGTTPNTFHDFAAGTFLAGDYEWQVRTADAQGVFGPFSASGFFTAASAPGAPTITDPISGGTIGASAYTVLWSAPNQDAYQFRTVADNAGAADTAAVYQDTGAVESTTARSRRLDFPVNNRHEHVQVRIRLNGLWSAYASVRVLVSYTPPAIATFVATPNNTAGTIGVAINAGEWPVTVSAVGYAGTGTGTMTGPTATAGVTDSHSWTATLVTAAVDGGTFDVAKDGTVIGQAVVGTQFTHEGLAFTISDGATDFALGDRFSWSTTATKTVSHDVWVRTADSSPMQDKYRPRGTGERIKTGVSPGGTYIDRAGASGVLYEWLIVSHGDNSTSSTSAWTA